MDELETTLGHELRAVAGGVRVPPMPALPQASPGSAHRAWHPLLVAAVVVLIVAGAVALGAVRGGEQPAPAPPVPSVPETTTGPPARTPPTVPYVTGTQLVVDGTRLPGAWQSVRSGESGWLALRADLTWASGRGTQVQDLGGSVDVPPAISPDGRYVAELRTQDGEGLLVMAESGPGGADLGSLPVDLGDRQDGSQLTIRAVTDDGRVVVQGRDTAILWLPLAGGRSVELAETAPGQVVLDSTRAGLVVTQGTAGEVDGTQGEPVLADLSDDGVLTSTSTVPTHDDLTVSPAGTWLVFTLPGTTLGDVFSIPTLQTRTVDGTREGTLRAPAGWAFGVRSGAAWEDDTHIVSRVLEEGGTRERMARCGVETSRCVLIDTD